VATIGDGFTKFVDGVKCKATEVAADVRLQDETFVRQQLDCVLDKAPCDELGATMKSKLPLLKKIDMGNFPRNCQWMKLEMGNFEKIVFGNRFISLASYGPFLASFSKISQEIENNLFFEFFKKLFSRNSRKNDF
jgi:hypothetical protein